MKLTETPEWNHIHNANVLESLTATNAITADGAMSIRVPKVIARIKLCGGALTFNFYDTDTVPFEMPTKEQCENLKKTFGIEVELVDEE